MRLIALWALLMATTICSAANAKESPLSTLEKIRKAYRVPGMALYVTEGGVKQPFRHRVTFHTGKTEVGGKAAVNAETLFPIASLTKVFASHAVIQLANQGKLSLDDPISAWIPNTELPPRLTLRDLLSHTLIGNKEKTFFYDQRFTLLTQIIQNSSGEAFESAVLKALDAISPGTHLLSYTADNTNALQRPTQLATGHRFEGQSEPIPHDFGLSASAGLTATPQALINSGIALMRTRATSDGAQHVFDSHWPDAIYANGLFRQQLAGEQVFWGYGQYDGYASLWIMVPDRELQLVMMANNNVLSDASRLIFGDLTTSPFAAFTARHFLCDSAHCRKEFSPDRAELHRQVYFSRYEKAAYDTAVATINQRYPSANLWKANGDKHLMQMSNYLLTVSHHLGYPAPEWAAHQLSLIEHQNTDLIHDPYWLFYAGTTYDRAGQLDKAREAYSRLTDIGNMPRHWTLSEAQAWLTQQP